MPFIHANDLDIFYEIKGDGPPLVLISGFAQHHLSCWYPYIEPLSKHFTVIAIDNRGSGQTEAPLEGYSVKMLGEDVAALLEKLEIENAHFMGQSMGTLIVQQLCISHPHLVKKAILCGPFAHLPEASRNALHCQLKLVEAKVDTALLFECISSWLFSNHFFKNPNNLAQFIHAALHDPYPQSLEGLRGQAQLLFDADLRKEIGQIPHQILLLVGEQDIMTPHFCADLIQAKIPTAQMHIFKEMGHLFISEIPDRVIKKVLHFLLEL